MRQKLKKRGVNMGWNNPSQEEAQECYDQAKARYNDAAENYCQTKAAYEQTYYETQAARGKCSDLQNDKVNFEKRITDIKMLIKFTVDRSRLVSTATLGAARSAEESMEKCVVCTGVKSPSLSSAFRVQDAENEPNSNEALRLMRKEVARLEQAVQDVNSQINAMEQSVADLTKRMNSLFSQQCGYKSVMNSSAYDMNHYNKFT